jgi:HEAT repeat protein
MLDLYKNLMALLKLYPEKVGEFAELLREFGVKDRRFDIVGVVLARNGSVPAQQEIIKAMDEMWADPEAVRLLSMSLALMDKPDDSIVTAMIDKYDDVPKDESRSILLGNLAGAGFHSQNPELKNKIRERVVSAIQSSGSDAEKSDAFLALGNLGHESTVDYVQTYIRSERPQDRIWAAQGVRRVGGARADEATQVLVDLSEADKDLQVRRTASSVMRGREFSEQQVDVLAAQLYKERDITVVMNILDSLADRSLNREKVREVLVNYFKECGTPSVCKKVENMLLSK